MKKGFTLIELLAVIVILAIIALIAVPIVLNIINNSKDSANKRSIEMYAKAIQNSITKEALKNKGNLEDLAGAYYTTGDKIITNGTNTYSISYKGNEITCKYIEIHKNGSVYLEGCKVGNSEKEFSYGTKEKIDYSKYTPVEGATWNVGVSGNNVVATLYDNAQFGGESGTYTLLFNGNGEMSTSAPGPFYSSQYREDITKVEIQSGVTSIGGFEFYFFTSLESITIPNSVTSIGAYAFQNCGLTTITIPTSVTSIHSNAFSSATNLQKIYYKGTATGAPWGAPTTVEVVTDF